MKQFIKDVLTNKDYGKRKAQAKARYNHKAGKRGYSDDWKKQVYREAYND